MAVSPPLSTAAASLASTASGAEDRQGDEHSVDVSDSVPFEVLLEVIKWLPVPVLFQTVRFVSHRWRDAVTLILRDKARAPMGRCLHVRRRKLQARPEDVPWDEYLRVVEGLGVPYAVNMSKAANLSGLERCRSVTHIDLFGSQLRSLHNLAGLTSLRSLNICMSSITDVSPLRECTSLTTLYMSYTGVSDLAPLADLRQLTTLDVSHTSAADASPLTFCPSLRQVNLHSTRVPKDRMLFNRKVVVVT